MKQKFREKFSYEPEADVLTLEVSRAPIDFAKEIGNVVVHFTKNNQPVLIEILGASKFLAKAENMMGKSSTITDRSRIVAR